jgi:predicted nucleic acid-binding protein
VKVLLDTNVIIDDALEREPFLAASEQVLVMVEERTIEGYIGLIFDL